jgi:hypothetical protein
MFPLWRAYHKMKKSFNQQYDSQNDDEDDYSGENYNQHQYSRKIFQSDEGEYADFEEISESNAENSTTHTETRRSSHSVKEESQITDADFEEIN